LSGGDDPFQAGIIGPPGKFFGRGFIKGFAKDPAKFGQISSRLALPAGDVGIKSRLLDCYEVDHLLPPAKTQMAPIT
jgi:hypothetical protein